MSAASDDVIQGTIPFSKLEPQFRETLAKSELDIDNPDGLTISKPNLELRDISWSQSNPDYLTIVTLIKMNVAENNINELIDVFVPGGVSVPASIIYTMDFTFKIDSWEISYDNKKGKWEAGDELTEVGITLLELFGPIISSSNFNENIEKAFESSVGGIMSDLPSDALEFVKDMDSGSVPESEFIKLLEKPKEALDFNGRLDADKDALSYEVKVNQND